MEFRAKRHAGVTLSAELTISAASASDFPLTALPEIALVGRSNVGKSSLINALVKQKIARTSAAPGKTRLANFYLIEKSFYLVDLPGYGYARGGVESAEAFEGLTTQYFDPARQEGRRLTGVFHLVDARHPSLDSDTAAHEWLSRTSVAIALVATKVDKLTQSERRRHLVELERLYSGPVTPVSAETGEGLDALWKKIASLTTTARP